VREGVVRRRGVADTHSSTRKHDICVQRSGFMFSLLNPHAQAHPDKEEVDQAQSTRKEEGGPQGPLPHPHAVLKSPVVADWCTHTMRGCTGAAEGKRPWRNGCDALRKESSATAKDDT
jgi:hypothetical protein